MFASAERPGIVYLVTGGTGTVGSCVARILQEQGKSLLLTSRTPSRAQAEEVTALDLASMSSIRAAADEIKQRAGKRRIILIHMAGGVNTSFTGERWGDATVFLENGVGPMALVEELRPRLDRIIAASSVGVRHAPATRRIISSTRPPYILFQYVIGKLAFDTYLAGIREPALSVALPATKGNFFRGEPRLPKLIMRIFAGRTVQPEISAGAILWALRERSVSGLVTVSRDSDSLYRLEQLWDRVDEVNLQKWIEVQLDQFMAQ